MEASKVLRPWAYRIENIPAGTTSEELISFFEEEDRPGLKVKSISSAVDNPSRNGELTAVIQCRPSEGSHQVPRLLNDVVSMDKDFYGLTPLNEPDEPIIADVIAVTGLAGHAYGSWAQPKGVMWLQDDLPNDVPNVRVLTYGYNTQLQDNEAGNIILNLSQDFIHRLLEMRKSANCQDRPIIFVGYSLGCLLIKKALVELNGFSHSRSRLPVPAIIFFGAPHRGLETTALETIVKMRPSEDLVKELQTQSPTLRELNDKFRHVVKNTDVLTCYETIPTRTAIMLPNGQLKREGQAKLMVPFFSAFLDLPKEQPLPCNADHSQIAKLRRGEGTKYYAVKAAVIKAVESTFEPVVGRTVLIPPDPAMQLELCTAVRTGDLQAVQILLARGCSIHSSLDEDQVDFEQDPFLLAAKYRQELIMRIFSKHNQNPSKRGIACGSTALHLLSFAPDGERKPVTKSLITLLLQCGVAIEARRKDSATPLLYSIACGQWKVAKFLLDHGANIHAEVESGMTSLMSATGWTYSPGAKDTGQLEMVSCLLDYGVDIHQTSHSGLTALHCAAWAGSVESIDLLISKGALVDSKDESGETPLWFSCRSGFKQVFVRLLHHGADCHVKNKSNSTLLHTAAFLGHPAIVEHLISQGAPLEARTSKTNNYETPLMASTQNRESSAESMRVLLKAGADIAATDNLGMTTLHLAAGCGNIHMVNELMAFGADIEALSKQRLWRPLHYAKYYGRWQIVEILLEKGATPRSRSAVRPSKVGWNGGDDEDAAPSDEDKERCMRLLRKAEEDEERKKAAEDEERKRRTRSKPFWKR